MVLTNNRSKSRASADRQTDGFGEDHPEPTTDCKTMDESIRECLPVYEIGYLIAGVPEERVAAEADTIKSIVADAGAVTIAEEAP